MTAEPARALQTEHSAGADVFLQVAEELRSVANATYRLQDALGEILSNAAGANTGGIPDLQEIDHVTQVLENLAQFMNSLNAPSDLALDTGRAAQYLTLAELASRLRKPGSSDPGSVVEPSGDLDLF